MKKFASLVAIAALALGGVLSTATAASAHTPNASATCETLTVSLTNYDDSNGNKLTVTIDNKVVESAKHFKGRFAATYSLGDKTVAHTYVVAVDAPGKEWDKTLTGTSTPCKPPVVVPDKPATIVKVDRAVELICEVQKINEVVTTTTTDFVLIDNVWVASEPVVTEEIFHREATPEECPPVVTPPVVTPPVVTPPVVTPPVVTPPVVTPPVVAPPVAAPPVEAPPVVAPKAVEKVKAVSETLPETGTDWGLLPIAGLLLALGGVVLLVAHKGRKVSQND